MSNRQKATLEELTAAYNQTPNVWRVAAQFGMCGQSVHERLTKAGIVRPMHVFTDAENSILLSRYETHADTGTLDVLAEEMGRAKTTICKQARALGLTRQDRRKPYNKGAGLTAWRAINPHPKGSLGKRWKLTDPRPRRVIPKPPPKWIGQGGNRVATDDQIIEAYKRLGSSTKAAKELGSHASCICIRLRRLKIPIVNNLPWNATEIAKLILLYPAAAQSGTIAKLAIEIGKSAPSINFRARRLGLIGMKDGARPWLSGARRKKWRKLSADEKVAQVQKSHETKMQRYGTLVLNKGEGLSWKAAWREVAGRRVFFRSTWEANWGRYLQWLKVRGDIIEWEHEPETFWFEKIRRGTRSYLPDFRVTERNGKIVYHEVKGWMDDKSKTKIARMKRYHPKVTLIVIDKKQYASVRDSLSKIIPEWETNPTRPRIPIERLLPSAPIEIPTTSSLPWWTVRKKSAP